MSYDIDTIDRKIIQQLLEDGRMSNAEIARRIEGVSERVVRYRIARLKKNGVIQVSAVVDPVKIGYPVIADVWIESEAGQAFKVADRLSELDLVRYVCYSTGGEIDVIAQVVAKNLESLYSYISEVIGNVPGVIKMQTMIIPGVLKDVDNWLPLYGDEVG